jgi:Methyl-CpG binding domain
MANTTSKEANYESNDRELNSDDKGANEEMENINADKFDEHEAIQRLLDDQHDDDDSLLPPLDSGSPLENDDRERQIESIRLPNNGNSTPVGPSSAVELIVASAARAAAGVALAEATTTSTPEPVARPSRSPRGASIANLDSPNSTRLASPPRRVRAKIVSAKSVLTSNPNRGRTTSTVQRGRQDTTNVSAGKQPGKQKVSTKRLATKKVPTKEVSKPLLRCIMPSPYPSKSTPTKAPSKSTKHKLPQNSTGKSPSALEVWSGVPTDDIEYSWDGWTKRTFQRQSGRSKGTKDSYWYTPLNQYKLRSLTEVRRYMELYQEHQNEVEAWARMKGK